MIISKELIRMCLRYMWEEIDHAEVVIERL